MPTSKLILTDIDDVVLDWRKAMSSHIIGCVDLHERAIPRKFLDHACLVNDDGLEKANMPERARIGYFNASPSFSALHAHSDAARVLPALHRIGYRFIAITAAGAGPEITERRRRNLNAVFGPIFDDVVCVGLHGSKRRELERHAPSIWVDDSFDNARDGADAGHMSFHFADRRAAPASDSRIREVRSWAEIAGLIGADIAPIIGTAAGLEKAGGRRT